MFQCLGDDILERAFEGYNACIFAYGQTGTQYFCEYYVQKAQVLDFISTLKADGTTPNKFYHATYAHQIKFVSVKRSWIKFVMKPLSKLLYSRTIRPRNLSLTLLLNRILRLTRHPLELFSVVKPPCFQIFYWICFEILWCKRGRECFQKNNHSAGTNLYFHHDHCTRVT